VTVSLCLAAAPFAAQEKVREACDIFNALPSGGGMLIACKSGPDK